MTIYQNFGWLRPKQSLFGQWTPHILGSKTTISHLPWGEGWGEGRRANQANAQSSGAPAVSREELYLRPTIGQSPCKFFEITRDGGSSELKTISTRVPKNFQCKHPALSASSAALLHHAHTINSVANYVINTAAIGIFGTKKAVSKQSEPVQPRQLHPKKALSRRSTKPVFTLDNKGLRAPTPVLMFRAQHETCGEAETVVERKQTAQCANSLSRVGDLRAKVHVASDADAAITELYREAIYYRKSSKLSNKYSDISHIWQLKDASHLATATNDSFWKIAV